MKKSNSTGIFTDGATKKKLLGLFKRINKSEENNKSCTDCNTKMIDGDELKSLSSSDNMVKFVGIEQPEIQFSSMSTDNLANKFSGQDTNAIHLNIEDSPSSESLTNLSDYNKKKQGSRQSLEIRAKPIQKILYKL